MSCKVLQVVSGEIRLGIQVCLTPEPMVSIAHGIHGTRDRHAQPASDWAAPGSWYKMLESLGQKTSARHV